MNDAVNIGMFREYIVESLLVPDVKTDEVWSFAADEFYAVNDLLGRIVEIVDNDNLVPSFEEGEGSEGANVASTPEIRSLAVERLYVDAC